jgi:hypothetical protein
MTHRRLPSQRYLALLITKIAGGGICALAGCLLNPGAAHADPISAWNNELLSVIRKTSPLLVDGPPEVAREIAIVGTSMFDAVNAATGLTYSPYAYTGGAVTGASADAAAFQAGYRAMINIFGDPIWTGAGGNAALITNTILPEINAVYAAGLTSLGGGAAVSAGLALGDTAANMVAAKRAGDGSAAAIINGLTPQAPPGSGTVPGVYVPPSATGGRPAMFPQWGTVAPFGVTPAQLTNLEKKVPGPPALNSQAYALGLLQTECAGVITTHALSPATLAACAANNFAPSKVTTDSALFWNDPGGTYQPPGHWLDITTTLMKSQHLTLAQSARLEELIGLALNDAGIASWALKYQYNLWRPITAIRDCGPAGNGSVTWNPFFTTCDPTWQSEINTPPHPDYVAGHPAFSGAAATVLEGFFGVDGIQFCSTSDAYNDPIRGPVAPITECYNSISEASSGLRGSTFSRVAGGIHSPSAVLDAEALGDNLGALILGDLGVAPVPEPAVPAIFGLALIALAAARYRRGAGNVAAAERV